MLRGKVSLVTGGSRGIGRAIVRKLAQEGVNIVLSYEKNDEAAWEVQKSLHEFGVESMLYKASVDDYEAVEKMVNAVIERFGRIDILVNNAGIGIHGYLKDMKLDDWNKVINVNFTAVFNTCRLVAPYMIRQNYGKIVNVSSMNGNLVSFEGTSSYSAAKAGVEAFTRVIAKELIAYNVNANCVAPGAVETDLISLGNLAEVLRLQTPAKRVAKPEEIACLVHYLCEDMSSYIVGKTFAIDGGFSLSGSLADFVP